MSHPARRDALRVLLRERDIDALYVGDLVNVRYLTGFSGSNGAVLIGADGSATFFTDGRYRDQAVAEVPDVDQVITRDLTGAAVARVDGVLAAETHVVSVDDWESLGKPRSAGRLVERLREVKDEAEIASLRTACAISTEALAGLLDGPIAGRTERELARDLEWRMLELGAEDKAFDTILAAGENTAIPHHHPTDRMIVRGDLLKIDFGAKVDGYHADCTRTVVVGVADEWQREVYEVVRASQAAGVASLTEGRPVCDVFDAAVDVLVEAGWRDRFTTGLGHGVGLQIHEDPFIASSHPGRLARRTVLTMEPGIYVPGRGGVRIEDTVVVTGPGQPPEALTTAPRDLMEIG